MTDKKKNKRICYIPGILTLAILPIFFILQVFNYTERTKGYVIPITIIPDKSDNSFNSGYGIPKAPADRKYLLFDFKEDKVIDSLKLLFIENILRGMERGRDTTFGVKMVFNNSLKYRTVIGAINTCLKSNINTFFIKSDTLISYHRQFSINEDTLSKFPKQDYSKFPCFLCNDIIIINPEQHQTFHDKIVENKRMIIISTLYLLWFIIIACLNIKKLIKINNW